MDLNVVARVRGQLAINRVKALQRWQRVRHPAWLARLHDTRPLSRRWGHDRGTPIDRYYVETFLNEHRGDIRGRVLEIRDSTYTDRFGVNVTQRDVLDLDPKNTSATFITDLASADAVPDNSMDCFILTQTLQFIYEPRAAIAHIHRFLKPNGVLLATVPGISRVDEALAQTDYWRFTRASCEKLFADCFAARNVRVRVYGNVLTAMAFLTGMAREDIRQHRLEVVDELYPVIIAVRALKR